ncbi:MAG: MgtC/SapB family protein [Oscillospiraceae bacterium]|nr:MgtC/SapB family protein [Oscillospiraceae bacterium]
MEALKQFVTSCWANDQVHLAIASVGRMCLAAVLGGVIGYERQHSHRPAGLRTHVLVAVGAALVMCTAESVMLRTGADTDPTRIGAQVVSGIGFLGAGTILRKGFMVEGLTTAASLWAVSCVGLAAGGGFWPGALVATIVLYCVLNYVKKVRNRISSIRTIDIGVNDAYHVSERVAEIFHVCGADLRSLEILFPDDSGPFLTMSKDVNKVLRAKAYVNSETDMALIKESLLSLEGVFDLNAE